MTSAGKFWNTVKKVCLLDSNVYKDALEDEESFHEAFWIVFLSSLSVSIGELGLDGNLDFFPGFVKTFLSWFIVALIIYYVGFRLFSEMNPEEELTEEEKKELEAERGGDEDSLATSIVTFPKVLRLVGIAYAPGMFRILGVVRGLVSLSSMISGVWILITLVIAVKVAFFYESTARAIIVTLLSIIIYGMICAFILKESIIY